MDRLFDSQVLGESSTQNHFDPFHAGEFAQPSLLSPVATIETATAFQHFPALRNISTRALFYIAADDSLVSLQDLGVSFPTDNGAANFLITFRAENPQFNYSHTNVVKVAAVA